MKILGADTPEDIDKWPTFNSLFNIPEEKNET